MSIAYPRLTLASVVAGGAIVVAASLALGSGCKKAEAPAAGPPSPSSASAPAPAAGGLPSAAASAAAAPSGGGAGAFGKGIIRGAARFKGKAPEARAITTPDPFCARQALKEEEVMVGPAGGLKNVLVRVIKGASGRYDTPSTDAVLDQSGCVYRPRVQALMAGQKLQIKNSDQTLHNVHTYKGASTVFNQAQIPGMGPMIKTFSDGGQIIKFKCDVHPWMTGYVAVATNPFFAVSGEDGTFAIEKLPAGAYTLEAWHERLGTRTAEITVTETDPVTATFDFAGA